MPDAATLLLVTHVPIRQGPRGPRVDDQTAAGITQWCRHFGRVTFYGIADDPANALASSTAWVDAVDASRDRATIAALPRAYRPGPMLREYRAVRATLRAEIGRHRHLCYSLGSLIGDWPAVAAAESIRQRRRYAAWIDRIEPVVIRNKLAGAPLRQRLAAAVALPVIEPYERHLLRRSAVALLQGRDAFDHYAKWAPDPHCTYDTHTQAADRISADALSAKQARVLSGLPLEIIYTGRAAAMKGPHDWLDTLVELHRRQVPFRATWIGDGPDLAAMRERVAGSQLAGHVDLPGFEADRETLLRRMRESDMLLFCHKTPESARCLVEALVSGCPIVGFGTAYSRGLVEARGGGAFPDTGDPVLLAERVAGLHRDRGALAGLIGKAAASGLLYDEDSVYAHAAGLMRLT